MEAIQQKDTAHMSHMAHKYNLTVPRYTSYPTAPKFSAFDKSNYLTALKALPDSADYSLYIHIPFCRQLCWYCGCQTKITKRDDLIEKYAYALFHEIELMSKHLDQRKLNVTHIHFGGGTPNTLPANLFRKLFDYIHRHFSISDDAEIAIELDPRTLNQGEVTAYAELGINRVSLGIQDFNHDVQKAIHRVQPYELVSEKLEMIRNAGIDAVNFDLIYGLPNQNAETINETLRHVETLSPDRLSVFAYAHVPWVKPHQKQLEKHHMPDAVEKLQLMYQLYDGLKALGYTQIGIDHFAKPDDSMHKAIKYHKLHRNFQGYTTDQSDYIIPFGSSAIGKLPSGYVQNEIDINKYQTAIASDELAVAKGYVYAGQDLCRAAIIEEIMCYNKLDLNELAQRFDITLLKEIWQSALPQLAKFNAEELVIEHEQMKLSLPNSETAVILSRIVSACFDQYLPGTAQQHAKAI